MRRVALARLVAVLLLAPALAAANEPATTGHTNPLAELMANAKPPAITEAAVGPETTPVMFRDLFSGRGKASFKASALHGKRIEMIGFMAPPPDYDDSPFLVLVGVPTTFCPYCSTVNDQEHLPFVLVYPDHELDQRTIGLRRRLKVTGILDAGSSDDDFFGIHNDLRLFDAEVVFDAYEPRIVRGKRVAAPDMTRIDAAQFIDE